MENLKRTEIEIEEAKKKTERIWKERKASVIKEKLNDAEFEIERVNKSVGIFSFLHRKDYSKAIFLLQEAVKLGSEEAKQRLKELMSK